MLLADNSQLKANNTNLQKMIDFKEAQRIIIEHAKSFGSEYIALEDADGRILAEDILADRDYPPFNRSAMDGYTFRFSDWQVGIRNFHVQEIIYAGMQPSRSLEPGACFKIMTGAPVPAPADVVIRREDSTEENSVVSFNVTEIRQFQNIAKKGEDLQNKEIALRSNNICSPAIISTLATLGKAEISVRKLPSVAFFTTGNEVKSIYSAVSHSQIRNSNEWLIKSLLKKWLIKPALYKHIADDPVELESNIHKATSYDILIMCGGVSAGDADFVPEAMEKAGIKKLFHKVAIKPGKPFWCGLMPNGGLVFALPGNPFSCIVTFKLFIEIYLSNSLGLRNSTIQNLQFEGKRVKKSNLDEFFPVKIQGKPSKLQPTSINGSGDIRLGIDADGLAHHPKENPELLPGVTLDFYSLL